MAKITGLILTLIICYQSSTAQNWINMAPVSNARVNGIAFSEDSTIWAVHEFRTNIFRSDDYGNSWVFNNTFNFVILDAVATMKNNIVLVGGFQTTQPFKPIIYRSTNHGASWTTVFMYDPSFSEVNGFKVKDSLTVYAYSNDGIIHRSMNAGLNWAAYQDTSMGAINDLEIVNDTLLISTDNGLYRGVFAPAGIRRFDSSSRFDDLEFIGGIGYGIANNRIIKSVDDGRSWQNIATNPLDTIIIGKMTLLDSTNFFVGGAFYNIFHSSDSGINWVLETGTSTPMTILDLTTFGDDVWASSIFGRILKRDFTTGLIEEANNETPKIYPNPIKDQLYFDQAVDRIEIMNLNGKLLHLEEKLVKTVQLDFLDSGIYLIKIYAGETVTSQKIIKK